jgi:hypothetical protein
MTTYDGAGLGNAVSLARPRFWAKVEVREGFGAKGPMFKNGYFRVAQYSGSGLPLRPACSVELPEVS